MAHSLNEDSTLLTMFVSEPCTWGSKQRGRPEVVHFYGQHVATGVQVKHNISWRQAKIKIDVVKMLSQPAWYPQCVQEQIKMMHFNLFYTKSLETWVEPTWAANLGGSC